MPFLIHLLPGKDIGDEEEHNKRVQAKLNAAAALSRAAEEAEGTNAASSAARDSAFAPEDAGDDLEDAGDDAFAFGALQQDGVGSGAASSSDGFAGEGGSAGEFGGSAGVFGGPAGGGSVGFGGGSADPWEKPAGLGPPRRGDGGS